MTRLVNMPIKDKEMKIINTDYFIYDRANDHIVCWDDGDIVFYGDLDEAIDDLYGNEEILTYDELPHHWKELVNQQIKQLRDE